MIMKGLKKMAKKKLEKPKTEKAEKTKKTKGNLYERMVRAAEDLQSTLVFTPPLDPTLPEPELLEKLKEAAAEVHPEDGLKKETWELLRELDLIHEDDEFEFQQNEDEDEFVDEGENEGYGEEDEDDEVEVKKKKNESKSSSPIPKTKTDDKRYTRIHSAIEAFQNFQKAKNKKVSFADLVDKSDQIYSDKTGKQLSKKWSELAVRRVLVVLEAMNSVEINKDEIIIQ